jgi:multiple sugar transport system permease protein
MNTMLEARSHRSSLAHATGRRTQRRLDRLVPYFFIGPAMLVVLLLVFAPAVANIGFSLEDGLLTSPQRIAFVGLEHYQFILTDPDVYAAVVRALGFALIMAVLAPTVGLAWALLLNENFPLRDLYRVVVMLPWVLSGIIVGRVWSWLVDPNFGYLAHLINLLILSPLGFKVTGDGWLGDPMGAWIAIILASTWGRFPFAYIMFLAGLQSIPRELYEAAMVDGASRFQRFRYITVPRLWFIGMIVCLLVFIGAFNDFGVILVMTQGGPADATMVLSYLIYQTLTLFLRFGRGAALALLVVVFLAGFSTLYLTLLRRQSIEEV